MHKTRIAAALMATLTSFMAVVHADDTLSAPSSSSSITVSATAASATFTFSGMVAGGYIFLPVRPDSLFLGTLTEVSVNATLDASNGQVNAADLTVYLKKGDLDYGGLLQVGGLSSLLHANERQSWANGNSAVPGATVIDTVSLTTPLIFTGSASDPLIWLGNGHGPGSGSGTWSGSITLTGITPVPEAGSVALMTLGGVGLAGLLRGRRARLPS